MTHSLHRKGNRTELKNDYVILAMVAADFNDKHENSRDKLLSIGNILKKHNPINIMPEAGWKISPVITAAYTDIESVRKVVTEIKGKNFGISIVISGLISEIEILLKEIDLKPHTIHFSLGIFGKKEFLPSEETLKITSMCGHHCISPKFVINLGKQVRLKKIPMNKAIMKLSKPCVCGIFNQKRAQEILESMIKRDQVNSE